MLAWMKSPYYSGKPIQNQRYKTLPGLRYLYFGAQETVHTRTKFCLWSCLRCALAQHIKRHVRVHFNLKRICPLPVLSRYLPLSSRTSWQNTRRTGSPRLCWLSALEAVLHSEIQHPFRLSCATSTHSTRQKWPRQLLVSCSNYVLIRRNLFLDNYGMTRFRTGRQQRHPWHKRMLRVDLRERSLQVLK